MTLHFTVPVKVNALSLFQLDFHFLTSGNAPLPCALHWGHFLIQTCPNVYHQRAEIGKQLLQLQFALASILLAELLEDLSNGISYR